MGSGALVLEFRKSSYGIATLTAGSLDFQDVIPRPRLRRAKRERGQKEGCNTRTSQEVTHPSTTLAQARLTLEFDGIRALVLV
ncbi:hypothetical protein SADUNF_Sadunf17G0028900 [Salix dunnii]|uniref:Uncharacterized protein n=1 Tax=Salix dunnii TaxID=1413687 RepID=A0A835MEL0_9ROSI|nr:hypothetical protein SADUNF_Sadunf17G0028900 [Salix dunnii]